MWLVVALPARSQTPHLSPEIREQLQAGATAQRSGDLEKAAQHYLAVTRLKPNFAEVYMNLGLVRYEQRRFEDVVTSLGKALELKPDLIGANLFLGISYYLTDRAEQSIPYLENTVSLDPSNAEAGYWLGIAYMEVGSLREAAKRLDLASKASPAPDVNILYNLGQVYHKLAKEAYERMFKADRDSFRVHQVLAEAYEEAGRTDEAIAEYKKVIGLKPTLPGINEALGSIYWKALKLTEAELYFKKELEVDPYNYLAAYKLGNVYLETQRPDEALPVLERAVRQRPNLIEARYELGKALAIKERLPEAALHFAQVLKQGPSSATAESAHYQLAQIYKKLGRHEEAKQELALFQALKQKNDKERQSSNRETGNKQ